MNKELQKTLLSRLNDEFVVDKRNNAKIEEDFTTYHDMVHAVRTKKPNEWESDIYLPEFLSRLLTQIGNFVNQYFGSTDYVETDMDSDDPEDVLESKASKKLLNSLLNNKKTH